MYTYLKCNFCKIFQKKKHNICVISNIPSHSDIRCSYNTLYSGWKWIVRLTIFSGPTTLIIWYFIRGFPLMIKYKGDPPGIAGAVATVITMLLGMFMGCLVIWIIGKIHQNFYYQGGTYFRKETKRR